MFLHTFSALFSSIRRGSKSVVDDPPPTLCSIGCNLATANSTAGAEECTDLSEKKEYCQILDVSEAFPSMSKKRHLTEESETRIQVASIVCRSCCLFNGNIELLWDGESRSFFVTLNSVLQVVPGKAQLVCIGGREATTWVEDDEHSLPTTQLRGSITPNSNGNLLVTFADREGMKECFAAMQADMGWRTQMKCTTVSAVRMRAIIKTQHPLIIRDYEKQKVMQETAASRMSQAHTSPTEATIRRSPPFFQTPRRQQNYQSQRSTIHDENTLLQVESPASECPVSGSDERATPSSIETMTTGSSLLDASSESHPSPDTSQQPTKRRKLADGHDLSSYDAMQVPRVSKSIINPPKDLEKLIATLIETPDIITGIHNQWARLFQDLAAKVNAQDDEIKALRAQNANIDAHIDKTAIDIVDQVNRKFKDVENQFIKKTAPPMQASNVLPGP